MTDPERPERRRGLFRRRRPVDPSTLHGQKIVTSDDLREVFDDGGEVEYLPGYRRKILHGVVLTILVAVIITAVLLALAIARGDLTVPFLQTEQDEPFACPTEVVNFPANEDVAVNVYNSTDQGGLAGSVADQLRERGYEVGEVGNRSLNNNSVTAVVVSGPGGLASALNLQRTIVNTEYLQDERTGETVDVVLGRAFAGLVPAKEVDQSSGQLSCPRLSPQPTPATGTATPPVTPETGPATEPASGQPAEQGG